MDPPRCTGAQPPAREKIIVKDGSKHMKIAVLCGGLSPERDVSLSSARLVCQALRSLGHKAVLVDVFFGLEG